jgi:hypothetical protein
MIMVTTGTVMPFRKGVPEPLKKNKIGKMCHNSEGMANLF